jgi:uncharacterized surface protein with fasciclin (FAS1) repeats
MRQLPIHLKSKPVTLKVDAGNGLYQRCQVIITDILTSNGMIQMIEKIILPHWQ